LASGTYAGHIAFLVCSDAACANTIGGTPRIVSFTVTVMPGVQATPAALSISQVSGQSATQDFTVQPGEGESSFTVGQSAAFVQISNLSATGFSVTLPSLPVGNYQSTIPLSGSLGSQSSIPVSYTVTAPSGGQHGLTISPTGLAFSAMRGAQSAPQSIMVDEPSWLPGLQAPTFSYDPGQDWLRLTPIAGGYSVIADTTNLASGTYVGYIGFGANPLPSGISTFETTFVWAYVSLTVGPGLVKVHLVASDVRQARNEGGRRPGETQHDGDGRQEPVGRDGVHEKRPGSCEPGPDGSRHASLNHGR
jgi:hypothetical protein